MAAGYVERNREAWTNAAPAYARRAPAAWARDEIDWGIWDIPESSAGCGTAYFSAWLARRGATPVGIDVTPAQLATARAMQERFELRFPLIQASVEDVPLRDRSIDQPRREGPSDLLDCRLLVTQTSPMSYRLPRTRAVDREDFLCALSAGKRVIHVGFAGPQCRDRSEPAGAWLHARLAQVARELVGIDLDPSEVLWARGLGYEAHAADCSDLAAVRALGLAPADVVIAGEVIEHVERPGRLLDAMHVLGDRLVVTTPNALSPLLALGACFSVDPVNPEHVAWYSPYTLSNLMRTHGWSVRKILTYHQPVFSDRGRTRLLAIQRLLARPWPFLDHGLIATAELTSR